MPDIVYEYILAQRKDNSKWHILKMEDASFISEHDTQEEAMAAMDKLMGGQEWGIVAVKDDDGTGTAMFEKRGKMVN